MTTAAEPDDRTLLQAHVDGDPDAFGVLFARHRDRLWAVALRTTGNPEDAADGLQDAMVAAFRRAGSFRGDAAVTTWLHRVVVNACLDRLRAASVRRTEPLPDDLDRLPDAGRGSAGQGFHPRDPFTQGRLTQGSGAEQQDPAEAVVQRDRRQRILEVLRELPDEQRAALVLVDMEGMSVAEAASVLECAEGTVKSRCSRGRRRLAVLLREAGVLPGNQDAVAHVPSTGPRLGGPADGRGPGGAAPGPGSEPGSEPGQGDVQEVEP